MLNLVGLLEVFGIVLLSLSVALSGVFIAWDLFPSHADVVRYWLHEAAEDARLNSERRPLLTPFMLLLVHFYPPTCTLYSAVGALLTA